MVGDDPTPVVETLYGPLCLPANPRDLIRRVLGRCAGERGSSGGVASEATPLLDRDLGRIRSRKAYSRARSASLWPALA